MKEPGTFTIFKWNGKDLFLQAPDEHFVVLSHQELTHDFRMLIEEGRETVITPFGEVYMVPTPAELEIARRTVLKSSIRLRIEDLKARQTLAITKAEREEREKQQALYEKNKAVRREQVRCSIAKAEAADEISLDPWSSIKLELLKRELLKLC